MKAGLNLFTLKKLIETEAGLLDTAKKLKEMGYSYVQYSGADFEPERIRRMTAETGLPVVLTHVPYERIVGDTENLMRDHESFGCRNIGLGRVPFHLVNEWDKCSEALEKMEKAGERMAKEGFSFFYHNHHYEFVRKDGKTFLDRLIEEAPHVSLTLDTYWIQYGGGDILRTVARLKGRIRCVHLKDYAVGLDPRKPEEDKIVPIFAPVGSGSLDFKAIVPAMKDAGAEYFLVEQDNATAYPDPLTEVRKSIEYIMKEL